MGWQDDLDALAQFSEGGPGVTRVAWTPALDRASGWLTERFRAAGMDATIDAAGNVIGTWGPDGRPAVLLGSHIDTVPNGGRFDGALGVVAALEVVRRLRQRVDPTRRRVLVAAFMDEEGVRFGSDLFGSRAFVGADLTSALQRTDSAGITVEGAMRSLGFNPDRLDSAAAVDTVEIYLELHIEQGPILENAGMPIGIPSGIVGAVHLSVELLGESNHAGTTPMDGRRDALLAASRAIDSINAAARVGDEFRATVGSIRVSPGATNVVPGGSDFTVDLRAASAQVLADAAYQLGEAVREAATATDVRASISRETITEPVAFDTSLRQLVDESAKALQLPSMPLISGAGHDAGILATHVPAAMVFVPSHRGLSHHPDEYTAADDVAAGIKVLERAVERLIA